MTPSQPFWWQDRAWRMVQTNLRETDMLDISAAQYVADLKAFHANAVIINTGGILANYDTKLPFHMKNPYLKGDSLETIVKACQNADIRVFARVDFSKVRLPIYQQHPDWAYLSPKGEIINYNGDVHMCFNGEYQRIHAISIMKEIVGLLDVDGFFLNMAGYQMAYDYTRGWQGNCQCQNCQRDFRKRHGYRVPLTADDTDPVYQKYLQYQRETTKEYYDNIQREIKAVKPEICLNKIDYLRTEAGTWVEIPGLNYHYKAAEITKVTKASNPGKVPAATTVDFVDMIYRFSAVSPHLQVLRVAESVANGGVADYYMMGRLDNNPDKAAHQPLQRIYAYLAEHEEDYKTSVETLSKIALIKPRMEGANLRNPALMGDYMGWFRLLSQCHHLFDCIDHAALEQADLTRYYTVILPDIQTLSDGEAAKLDRFVKDGGTLIADGEPGFRDGENVIRPEPALQSLGIARVGLTARNLNAAYFQLDSTVGFPRFAESRSEVIHLYGDYVYADYLPDTEQGMRLIPPHFFAPPERAYHTNVTDYPACTVHRYGQGRGVYLPWKPAADYHEYGFPAPFRFLQDLLEHRLGIPPVGGNLPPMVEVSYTAQPDGSARYIHLVNSSGQFINAYFDPITLTGLEVMVPCDKPVASVRSMVRNNDVTYTQQDGTLRIVIDSIELLEAVKITI